MNIPTNCPFCKINLTEWKAEWEDNNYSQLFCNNGNCFAFNNNIFSGYSYRIVANIKNNSISEIYLTNSEKSLRIEIYYLNNKTHISDAKFNTLLKLNLIPNIDISSQKSIDETINLLLTFQ